MIAVKSNINNFANEDQQIFSSDYIQQILNKLVVQEQVLQTLQQSIIRERNAKESLQADFEHVISQLKFLQQCEKHTHDVDVTYII